MISVVVPVYKVEPYIEKCIESVIDQVFCDWELILVDDGSPDGCGEICDRYAAADERIRVIHQENAGLSAARNAAMEVVRGDYVTFVDADDFIGRNHLNSLYEALEEYGADISVAGCLEVGADGLPLPGGSSQVERTSMTGVEACGRLLQADETFLITAWGKLYARRLFPLIRYPEGRLNEDEYVTYQLLYESRRVSFTGENSYNYVRRDSGITAAFTEKHVEVADAFRDAVTYFDEKQDSQMKAIAQKRLLREVRVLYVKSEGLPDATRARLLEEWRCVYRQCRESVAKISSLPERLLCRFFGTCPNVYSKIFGAKCLYRTGAPDQTDSVSSRA